jgi:hypothetical protein
LSLIYCKLFTCDNTASFFFYYTIENENANIPSEEFIQLRITPAGVVTEVFIVGSDVIEPDVGCAVLVDCVAVVLALVVAGFAPVCNVVLPTVDDSVVTNVLIISVPADVLIVPVILLGSVAVSALLSDALVVSASVVLRVEFVACFVPMKMYAVYLILP